MSVIGRWSKTFLELLSASLRGIVQKSPPTPILIPHTDWRQGSVIPIQLITSAQGSFTLSHPLEPEGLIILITQDCDIVHHSYQAEPYVEALIARPLPPERHNGNLFYGKNPRQLQFVLNTPSSAQLYAVNIHEKTKIDRKVLLAGTPDTNARLDSITVDLLARWTAKRYTRAAFPNEFNERCRRAARRIGDRLKAKSDLITGVFLRLNSWDELSATENYEVLLYVTALPETCNDQAKEETALSLFAVIERELNDCNGIQVVDGTLIAETEVSLRVSKNDLQSPIFVPGIWTSLTSHPSISRPIDRVFRIDFVIAW